MKRLVARLILAVLAGAAWQAITADVLKAQEGTPVRQGVPEQAGAAPDEGVAVRTAPEQVVRAEVGPEELTEEEVRDLLVKESIERYRERWGARQTYLRLQKCGDDSGYIRLGGPTIICEPSEVPAELIQDYRVRQENLRSTFLTEPTPEFLTQPTPKF